MFWSKQIGLKFLRFFLLCSLTVALTFYAVRTNGNYKQPFQEPESDLTVRVFLNAKVAEIGKDSMLVEPINAYEEYDEILVYIGFAENDSEEVLKEDDLVRIEYDGSVRESIPPQMTALSVKKR